MPLVIDGYGFAEIRGILEKSVNTGNTEAFQVANSTLSDYIRRCRERIWEQAAHLDLDHEFAEQLAKLKRLYTRASHAKDLRTALAVTKQLIELLGLAAPTRIDVTMRRKADALTELVWGVVQEAQAITAGAAGDA